MIPIARLVALFSLLIAAALPAHAADAVFPPGARIGLVPAAGLTPAKDFLGFQSEDGKTKVGLAEIPPAAFESVDAAYKEAKPAPGAGIKPEPFDTASGKKGYLAVETGTDGATAVKTYSLILPAENFSAYLLVQTRDDGALKLSDEAVRAMLATAVVRASVPVEEQLALLPFKVTDLAGFKTVRNLALNASVLLTDGSETTTLDGAPYIVIGTVPSAPASPDERARFAQQAAAAIPGLREARITSNEPLRIDGTPGFETRISAVTGKNDTPVTIVQWLRFGSGATLRIVASATTADWPKAFPRFRAVRDGIAPR